MWEEECGKDRGEVELLEKYLGLGWGGVEQSWTGKERGWGWAGVGWDWGEAPAGLWVGWSHQRQAWLQRWSCLPGKPTESGPVQLHGRGQAVPF